MATDIKEFFSKFFDWNNDPQRYEVYSVLEEATKGFQKGRCEALLYDLERMVEDWKYKELCDSINRENEFRAAQVDEAFRLYEQAFVNNGEWGLAYEEYERLKQELVPLPPPFPDADTSTIPTPPIFDYAFSLLCRDGEEPPRKAASTPTAPATGQDDEAATPTPVQLPPELQTDEATTSTQEKLPPELQALFTDRAIKYFAKAIDRGYMVETDNGYKWLWGYNSNGRGGKIRLAYFIEKVYNPDGTTSPSWKKLQILFGEKHKFDSSKTGLQSHKPKSKDAKAKKVEVWKAKIDELFTE